MVLGVFICGWSNTILLIQLDNVFMSQNHLPMHKLDCEKKAL